MFFIILIGFETPFIAIHLLWINLITDSLPAVALGADEKESGIMDDKPRNPKESLFSKGGYAITFGYGLLITLTTVFAFLMIPVFEGGARSLQQIAELLTTNEAIRMQSQTAAFCVLSLSELFHMLGMTSLRKSFVHNFWSKNWLLW